MNVFKKTTPEEKLLHIIENPDKANKFNKGPKGGAPQQRQSRSGLKKARVRKISLQGVNKILIGISIIVTITLIVLFIKNEKTMEIKFENLKATIEEEAFKLSKSKEDFPDISHYLVDVGKNNPFQLLGQMQQPKAKEVKTRINLKLVGIIWSDIPQAIIEDESANKTYMVFQGDVLDKFTVEEITPNEVKLVSEDGETMLR